MKRIALLTLAGAMSGFLVFGAAAAKCLSVNTFLPSSRLSDTVSGHEGNQVLDGVRGDVGQG